MSLVESCGQDQPQADPLSLSHALVWTGKTRFALGQGFRGIARLFFEHHCSRVPNRQSIDTKLLNDAVCKTFLTRNCVTFSEVELTSDLDTRLANPVHRLTEQDSFDVTVPQLSRLSGLSCGFILVGQEVLDSSKTLRIVIVGPYWSPYLHQDHQVLSFDFVILFCISEVSPRAGAMGEWTKHLSMTPRQHDFRQFRVQGFDRICLSYCEQPGVSVQRESFIFLKSLAIIDLRRPSIRSCYFLLFPAIS